jgi:hypothetical protein
MMQTRSVALLALVFGLALSASNGALAQTSEAAPWSLPRDIAVRDSGTRVYRFTVDYQTADPQGAIVHRQRISGEYTRGLAGGEVEWKNVFQSEAEGPSGPFGGAQKRTFMEGLRYRNDLGVTMQPEFFKTFPAAAVVERNLVWDSGMIELFGQGFFEKLKLNEPYHAMADQNVKMPDVGTFHNRDVILEWVGRSYRNGQDCAVIDYRAFLNPLQVAAGGMTLRARSDYWGQIWVSLKTKQIEYGTLYENVLGDMKLPGQDAPQPLSVFRSGVFEPLVGRSAATR